MAENIPLDLKINVKGGKNVGKLREQLGNIKKDVNTIDTKKARKEFKGFGSVAKKGLGDAQNASLLFVGGNQQLAAVLAKSQLAFKAFAGASTLVGTGLKLNIGLLKAFKIALAATGIGAIVIALASLIAFFTKTERGIEIVNKVSAAFGATVDVLVDRLSAFGEVLFAAFRDPQQAIKDFGELLKQFVLNRVDDILSGFKGLGKAVKLLFERDFKGALAAAGEAALDLTTGLIPVAGLIKDSKDAIAGLVDEINKEAGAAINLQGRLDALVRSEREVAVERSKQAQEIARLRFLAEDRTKSEEERLAAIIEAGAIEEAIVKKEITNATERKNIITAQVGLGESLVEDLQKQADAEIALNGILTNSFNLRKGLAARQEGISREVEATRDARTKEREEKENEQLQLEFDRAANELELRKLQASENLTLQLEILTARKDLELEFFDKEAQLEEERLIAKGESTKELLITQDTDRKLLEAQFADESAKLRKKRDDDEIADAKATRQALFASAQVAAGSLISLAEASIAEGKKGEQARRNLASAQIAIDTGIALAGIVSQAATNPTNLLPGALILDIALRSVTVLANIAKARNALNAKTTPSASTAGGGGGGVPDVGGGRAIEIERVRATQLTPEGEPLRPVEAVVVETQLSRTQTRVRSIENNAKIA